MSLVKCPHCQERVRPKWLKVHEKTCKKRRVMSKREHNKTIIQTVEYRKAMLSRLTNKNPKDLSVMTDIQFNDLLAKLEALQKEKEVRKKAIDEIKKSEELKDRKEKEKRELQEKELEEKRELEEKLRIEQFQRVKENEVKEIAKREKMQNYVEDRLKIVPEKPEDAKISDEIKKLDNVIDNVIGELEKEDIKKEVKKKPSKRKTK